MKYRYPGSTPFTDKDQDLFFGRTDDLVLLQKSLLLHPITVLHAKSGLGKTSLIQAGLVPSLKDENYKIISIRFGNIADSPQSSEGIFYSQFESALLLEEDHLNISLARDTLWYLSKNWLKAHPESQGIILIIDQAEEIFYNQNGLGNFGPSIAELLNNIIPKEIKRELRGNENSTDAGWLEHIKYLEAEIPIKFLFSIRSDQLNLLYRIQEDVPNILKHSTELSALNKAAASKAILLPAQLEGDFYSPSYEYEEEALDHMLDYLSHGNQAPIESFQLQILCSSLEKRLLSAPQALESIDKAFLGDLDLMYENYYQNLIQSIGTKEEIQLSRKLLEEGLILEKEAFRINLYEGKIKEDYGVDDSLLSRLVDTHLIRAESHTDGSLSYELSHDTLVAPLLLAKERRQKEKAKKEELLDKERKLLEQKEKLEQKSKRRLKILKRAALLIIATLLTVYTGILLAQHYKLARLNLVYIQLEKEVLNSYDGLQRIIEIDSVTKENPLLLSETIERAQDYILDNKNKLNLIDQLDKKLDGIDDLSNFSQGELERLITDFQASINELQAKDSLKDLYASNKSRDQGDHDSDSLFADFEFDDEWKQEINPEKLSADSTLIKNPYAKLGDFKKQIDVLIQKLRTPMRGTTYGLPIKTGEQIKKTERVEWVSPNGRNSKYKISYSKNENGGKNCVKIEKYSVSGNLLGKKVTNFPYTVLDISPNGKHIIAGDNSGRIYIRESSGKGIKDFQAHTGAITALKFSKDGKAIYSASKAKDIKKWDMKTVKEVESWENYDDARIFKAIPGKTIEEILNTISEGVLLTKANERDVNYFYSYNDSFIDTTTKKTLRTFSGHKMLFDGKSLNFYASEYRNQFRTGHYYIIKRVRKEITEDKNNSKKQKKKKKKAKYQYVDEERRIDENFADNRTNLIVRNFHSNESKRYEIPNFYLDDIELEIPIFLNAKINEIGVLENGSKEKRKKLDEFLYLVQRLEKENLLNRHFSSKDKIRYQRLSSTQKKNSLFQHYKKRIQSSDLNPFNYTESKRGTDYVRQLIHHGGITAILIDFNYFLRKLEDQVQHQYNVSSFKGKPRNSISLIVIFNSKGNLIYRIPEYQTGEVKDISFSRNAKVILVQNYSNRELRYRIPSN